MKIIEFYNKYLDKYYIKHCYVVAGITLLIGISTGYWLEGVVAGVVFYIIREIYQRVTLGYWDLKGLLYPSVFGLVLALIIQSVV